MQCLLAATGKGAEGYGVAVNDVAAVARVQVDGGGSVERLACHPRLPLVAGLGSERPAVHVWEHRAGQLHEVGSVGAESRGYGDAVGWNRAKRTPAVAWHPEEPLLVVAEEGGVLRWTPAGLSEPEGVPPLAHYRSPAFSPETHLAATPGRPQRGAWPQPLTASAICRAAWAGVRCVVSTTSASPCSHVRAASA